MWRHPGCRSYCLALLALVATLAVAARAARQEARAVPLGSEAGLDSSEQLARAKALFLSTHGDAYGYKGRIDSLFAREVAPRLPRGSHYLDYTAATLYWNSLVQAVADDLKAHVYGNPHSSNFPSNQTSEQVEAVREDLLRFFGADPAEYTLVFTRSATAALTILANCFPWSAGRSSFLYTRSNHNSVLGVRQVAHFHGARVGSMQELQVENWVADVDAEPEFTRDPGDEIPSGERWRLQRRARSNRRLAQQQQQDGQEQEQEMVSPELDERLQRQVELDVAQRQGRGASQDKKRGKGGHSKNGQPAYSLFAYPAYDNYAGVLYPLNPWVHGVHAKNNDTHKWKVLVDTAAWVPHHPLNLTSLKADVAIMSFYKMFGLPTGVGALVARKDLLEVMGESCYWGGGSVFTATAGLPWHIRREAPEGFEDGTPPFLEIISIKHGLEVLRSLGGIEAISAHSDSVAQWLYDQLTYLRHTNGQPMVDIWGKWTAPPSIRPSVQGPTINFLLLQPDGSYFSYKAAMGLLSEAGFYIRSGCTCNPGVCYNRTGVLESEVRALAEAAMHNGTLFNSWEWIWVSRPGNPHPIKLPLGSLRLSLGYMSRFEDAYHFVSFIAKTFRDAWYEPGLKLGASAKTLAEHADNPHASEGC